MAQPARGSLPRLIPAVAVLIGLSVGSLSRSAAAQPKPDSASEPADVAESAPASQLDQYPPPAARTNLLIASAATTATWYGLALAASYAWPTTVGANDLRIPVAGPWIALSHSGCGNVSDCSKVIVVLRAIATTLDAIGQAAGLAIAAEGLFMPTQEPRRAHAALPANRDADFALRPTFDAGKNSVGFGVLGVF